MPFGASFQNPEIPAGFRFQPPQPTQPAQDPLDALLGFWGRNKGIKTLAGQLAGQMPQPRRRVNNRQRIKQESVVSSPPSYSGSQVTMIRR